MLCCWLLLVQGVLDARFYLLSLRTGEFVAQDVRKCACIRSVGCGSLLPCELFGLTSNVSSARSCSCSCSCSPLHAAVCFRFALSPRAQVRATVPGIDLPRAAPHEKTVFDTPQTLPWFSRDGRTLYYCTIEPGTKLPERGAEARAKPCKMVLVRPSPVTGWLSCASRSSRCRCAAPGCRRP